MQKVLATWKRFKKNQAQYSVFVLLAKKASVCVCPPKKLFSFFILFIYGDSLEKCRKLKAERLLFNAFEDDDSTTGHKQNIKKKMKNERKRRKAHIYSHTKNIKPNKCHSSAHTIVLLLCYIFSFQRKKCENVIHGVCCFFSCGVAWHLAE